MWYVTFLGLKISNHYNWYYFKVTAIAFLYEGPNSPFLTTHYFRPPEDECLFGWSITFGVLTRDRNVTVLMITLGCMVVKNTVCIIKYTVKKYEKGRITAVARWRKKNIGLQMARKMQTINLTQSQDYSLSQQIEHGSNSIKTSSLHFITNVLTAAM